MNQGIGAPGHENPTLNRAHSLCLALASLFFLLYFISTVLYLLSVKISLNFISFSIIFTLLGMDSHVGIPVISKVFLSIFLIFSFQARLYGKIKDYSIEVKNYRVINRIYLSICYSAGYIIAILMLQSFYTVLSGKTLSSISNGTETLIFLILLSFAISGILGIFLLSYYQGRFLPVAQRVRITYLSAFLSFIIFMFISFTASGSLNGTAEADLPYYLIPFSGFVMITIGYYLRFKDTDTDPSFLINASGPAVVLILLALMLLDYGNSGLITYSSPVFFFEYLFLWLPAFSLIVAISSKAGYSMKRTSAKTALYSLSFLTGFIAIFIFLLSGGFLSSGPIAVFYSLPLIVETLFSLLLFSELVKSGLLVIFFISFTYFISKGILSRIKNEVYNLISLSLSFILIFFIFAIFIENSLISSNMFNKGSFLLQDRFGFNVFTIIATFLILAALFVIFYVVSGMFSPGTRKGGLMASIAGLYFVFSAYFPQLNLKLAASQIYFASFLSIAAISYAASAIATPFRFSFMNEDETDKFKNYERSMIVRGTNQNGVLYEVTAESFSTLNLVGLGNSGKTTFLAFFLNFMDYLTDNTKFTWDIKQGIETMESLLNSIIVSGQFPEKNQHEKNNVVSIELQRKGTHQIEHLTITDWDGKRLEKNKDKPIGNLSNGKAYAVFIDESMFSNLSDYDSKIASLLQNILNNRKKNLPEPKFCFLLFNFQPGSVDIEGQSPKETVMLLPLTKKIIQNHLPTNTIFIRPRIKTKSDKEKKISIETEMIDGILRIPYDEKDNYPFKIFFGWLLIL